MTDLKYVGFEKRMRFFYRRHVDFSNILNVIIYTATDFFGGFCDMEIIVPLCRGATSDFFKHEGEGEFPYLMGVCIAELQMIGAIKVTHKNECNENVYVRHLCKKMFDESIVFLKTDNDIKIFIDDINKNLKEMLYSESVEISGKGGDEAVH